MTKDNIYIIKNNKLIYNLLREESYHYKYLYRDDNYIKKLDKLSKKKYNETFIDKTEKLINNINFIKTFLSVID